MSTLYEVKRGDTLSKIASRFGVSKHEIAAANAITDQNYIREGQVLEIPLRVFDVKPQPIAPNVDLSNVLALQFWDAANKPIAGMEITVSSATEKQTCTTDENGRIPSLIGHPDETFEVEVKKPSGEWKKISEVKLTNPTVNARIVSPKVATSSEMRPHQGPAQTSKKPPPEPTSPGATKDTRSANGNPVHLIALECPNPENLRLGPNAKYRDIIIAAAQRSKFSPQSIAAIMNAEAATISKTTILPVLNTKTGQPLIGKNGKPVTRKLVENTGEWSALSASDQSSARGMTQFLDGSWIDMALQEGSFLNEYVKAKGWLTKTTITKKVRKRIIHEEVEAFRLSNGTFVTARRGLSLVKVLASREYITAWAVASDKNLQELLDLRFDPKLAINAAVDYGLQNLAGLTKAGYKIANLSDGDKAKLIYLTHHLGLDDAKKFIDNTITSEKAERLLVAQVKRARADAYAEANGNDYVKGHRAWLLDYIDRKIDLAAKMCDKSKAGSTRPLLAITLAIR